jgi:hemolysin activation/secretion protein
MSARNAAASRESQMHDRRRIETILASLLLMGGALGLARDAHAQGAVLPGKPPPEVESFPDEEPTAPPLELPPLPPSTDREGELAAGLRVFVRGFRVEGSTVFSAKELSELTEPWTGRAITSEDLLRVRDAITRHYAMHGYLTSGALIPDQPIADGIVIVRVVEGELEEIQVHGTRRFRPGYFRTRLSRAGRAPVSVKRLESSLQQIQRDPRVRRVRARLEPGERSGESVLLLEVEENRSYGLGLRFSNENSPSVGSYTGSLEPVLWNLSGWGDEWRVSAEITDGLRIAEGSVSIPLPPFDTLVDAHFQFAKIHIVENPFDDLDIENESSTYGFTLRQPLLRDELQQLHAGVIGEHRTSNTSLLGECFAFVPETAECEARVSVVRLFGEWLLATRSDVVAARSMLSIGVDALGATSRGGDLPDSEYLAWLGQLQWAHRLPPGLLDSEVLFRVDTQLSDAPLLGIEKFSVGGMRTVRGYRENQLVRDNGVVTSAELRVPVWWDSRGRPIVQLASFIDYGRSWEHRESGEATTLWSAGVGLRVAPWPWLRGQLYWGHAFTPVVDPGGDLQDDGIHFVLTAVPL